MDIETFKKEAIFEAIIDEIDNCLDMVVNVIQGASSDVTKMGPVLQEIATLISNAQELHACYMEMRGKGNESS